MVFGGEGEGGGDVRVVACVVHQHNLIELSLATGDYIGVSVNLFTCGKAVNIK